MGCDLKSHVRLTENIFTAAVFELKGPLNPSTNIFLLTCLERMRDEFSGIENMDRPLDISVKCPRKLAEQ